MSVGKSATTAHVSLSSMLSGTSTPDSKNMMITTSPINHHPANTSHAPNTSSISSNFVPVQFVYFPQARKNVPIKVSTIAPNVAPKKHTPEKTIWAWTGPIEAMPSVTVSRQSLSTKLFAVFFCGGGVGACRGKENDDGDPEKNHKSPTRSAMEFLEKYFVDKQLKKAKQKKQNKKPQKPPVQNQQQRPETLGRRHVQTRTSP